jgi:hypothetical protein
MKERTVTAARIAQFVYGITGILCISFAFYGGVGWAIFYLALCGGVVGLWGAMLSKRAWAWWALTILTGLGLISLLQRAYTHELFEPPVWLDDVRVTGVVSGICFVTHCSIMVAYLIILLTDRPSGWRRDPLPLDV